VGVGTGLRKKRKNLSCTEMWMVMKGWTFTVFIDTHNWQMILEMSLFVEIQNAREERVMEEIGD
jgi:hypothetical protein